MELDSRFAGVRMRSYQTRVHWRQITNYAAATGDNNPIYFDDRHPEGLVAPPDAGRGPDLAAVSQFRRSA